MRRAERADQQLRGLARGVVLRARPRAYRRTGKSRRRHSRTPSACSCCAGVARVPDIQPRSASSTSFSPTKIVWVRPSVTSSQADVAVEEHHAVVVGVDGRLDVVVAARVVRDRPNPAIAAGHGRRLAGRSGRVGRRHARTPSGVYRRARLVGSACRRRIVIAAPMPIAVIPSPAGHASHPHPEAHVARVQHRLGRVRRANEQADGNLADRGVLRGVDAGHRDRRGRT